MSTPVFRFAPSPNGELHLGHACSALLNDRMAAAAGARLLLRMEDIDTTRCTLASEAAIMRDLSWLGIRWEEPVRRQSEHFDAYRDMLERLRRDDLVYPAFMSRGEIRSHIAESETTGRRWPLDPDGVPLYPAVDRRLTARERKRRIDEGAPFSWRLDMQAALSRLSAPLTWREFATEEMSDSRIVEAQPQEWGDIVIVRREIPTCYHLSVVTDDMIQGVSHVVRGRDLFAATSVQRLLQELLGLPAPIYFHHRLILGPDGRKLSKSRHDSGLALLREQGLTPADIKRMVRL